MGGLFDFMNDAELLQASIENAAPNVLRGKTMEEFYGTMYRNAEGYVVVDAPIPADTPSFLRKYMGGA